MFISNYTRRRLLNYLFFLMFRFVGFVSKKCQFRKNSLPVRKIYPSTSCIGFTGY